MATSITPLANMSSSMVTVPRGISQLKLLNSSSNSAKCPSTPSSITLSSSAFLSGSSRVLPTSSFTLSQKRTGGFSPILATAQELLVQWSNKNLQYGANILHFQTTSTRISSLSFAKPTLGAKRNFSPRCSLHDQLDSVSKTVVGLDPSLAVKNKAAELSSELKGTSIFLVGINSNIKTKLGNVLADALRYYYFDSESLVEQAAGESAVVLRERDEKGFLDSETEVLKQLSSMGRLVVCTGDGAVQSSTNLALMRHGISIWIDIPIPVIAREGSQRRPSYATTSDHSEVLSKLNAGYEKMKERYAIADAKISLEKVAYELGYDTTEAVSIEDMAVEVFVEIEKLTRVKKMMEDAARPF